MKRCPYCAEEIQDQAIKCRFCNTMLTGAPEDNVLRAAAGAATPAPAAASPHAIPPGGAPATPAAQGLEPHRTLFEGSPSWRSSFWHYVAAIGIVVAGAGVGVYGTLVATNNDFKLPFGLAGGALALGGVIWILVQNMVIRSRRFRITSQTIDIERGLFGKTITTLQLWRIHDIDFAQSFGERLLGIARIHILSQDEEQPNLTLAGLPGSRSLFDAMKEAIALARQSRNVVGMVR